MTCVCANATQHQGLYGRCEMTFGAGDGIRTRDVNLGKVALYH